MAFERFIKDKLTMPIEDIFVDINKYIEAHDVIDTEVLYIDGTKFEANANKMTFVWMKATKKFREKRWIKVMDRLSAFNKYCSKNNLNIRFSCKRYNLSIRRSFLCLKNYLNQSEFEEWK